MSRHHPFQAQSPSEPREKIKVALISVGAALFLIAAKATVGLLTGSLAILAEAAHSGLDLFASLVTALSVRAADRPADRDHHYGHGKIESLSALFESTLLFITCVWIFKEGIHRLTVHSVVPEINVFSFAVILVAIAVDYSRYRILMRTAKKYHSQALEADAVHFYSDILSSSLVLIGLFAVSFGFAWADAAAALAVALWVGYLSIRLAKKNLDILLDRVPDGYAESIRAVARSVPGVVSIDRLRLRRSGSSLFADLRVGMDRSLSFRQAHQVARNLERELAQRIRGLDAVVHMNPTLVAEESFDIGVLNYIKEMGFRAHHVTLRRLDDRFNLELHLEMPGDLSLGEAHHRATDLETKLAKQFPEINHIVIHIEEIGGVDCIEIPFDEEKSPVIEKIRAVCAENLGEGRCHDIKLGRCREMLNASMHCLFPPDRTVAEIHQMTTKLEEELLKRIPELHRIVIHAEPISESSP